MSTSTRVPGSWQGVALRHVAIVIDCKHRTVPFVDDGVPVASIGEVHGWSVDLSNAKQTTEEEFVAMIEGGREPKEGDVVVSRNATVGAAALVTGGERFCLGQDVSLIRCGEKLLPEFLNWLFRSPIVADQISSESIGATFSRINVEQIKALLVPLPPLALQRATASWLARSVGAVDEVLAAKQRLLDLLAEKRKAIIATAVIRGLEPKVRLRDSGVPWLGEIPEHWDVTRLKFHLNGITQGWSPQCEALPAGPDDWGVLKAGCVNGDTFDAEENKRLPDSETPLAEIEVRPRDVVMSRANTTELVGSAAITPADVRPRLMLSDKLYRLNVNADELLPEFLVHFLRTPSGRFDFERTASGASNSMQNISQDVVRNLWLPVPPQNEQHAIVERIARETVKLDAVRAATERTIALLKERRSALIAAAVTGQLDLGATA